MKNKIYEILNKNFNLTSFRPNQYKTIENILKNKNSLIIIPTGGGKSLTYQISGMYNVGTTIVISPLISLMKDQVDYLNSMGIPSELYNSSLSKDEKKEVYQKIEDDLIKFLFISPERLDMEYFIQSVKMTLNINLIAVDEAHCISSWGHDFRESYLGLSKLFEIFPNVPVLALTATADNLTKNEILKEFNIDEKSIFESPVERKNIEYFIEKKNKNGFLQVEQIIKKYKGKKGIIYCFKRDDVDKLTRSLRSSKLSVKGYHAGLSTEKRERVMKEFMNDKIDVIVATIAFGMGIDKSNIRYIVHKDIPKNIESYYQETGRAGRDGKLSKTILLYSGRDATQRMWIMNSSNRKNIDMNKFSIMKSLVETTFCKKEIINWYFDNKISNKNCGKCSICKKGKLKKIQNTKFLEYINNNLINETFIKPFIDRVVENTEIQPHIIQNYIWQLIFSEKIGFDKTNNKIYLIDEIKKYEFNELLEIPYNFKVVEKKKKIVKKRKPTVRKKASEKKKSTLKPKKKRTLSKTQIKKMQEGRKKASEKKKSTLKPKKKRTLSKTQIKKMQEGRKKAAEKKK